MRPHANAPTLVPLQINSVELRVLAAVAAHKSSEAGVAALRATLSGSDLRFFTRRMLRALLFNGHEAFAKRLASKEGRVYAWSHQMIAEALMNWQRSPPSTDPVTATTINILCTKGRPSSF